MEQYTVVLSIGDWRTILHLAEDRAEEEDEQTIQDEYFRVIGKAHAQLGW